MKKKIIWIPGSAGMLGQSILRTIDQKKYKVFKTTRKQLDLFNKKKIETFIKKNKIKEIILCASKVGGIYANDTFPADFLLDNLTIQNNIFNAVLKYKIRNFTFIGSSCIYPKKNKMPIREEYLLTGPLEKTNYAYAIAKIAGVKTVQRIVEASITFKVPIISFYVFSTENWKRPKTEIKYLFKLIDIYFNKEINNIIKNNIKVTISGRIKKLPIKIQNTLKIAVNKTKKNNKLTINLAINYGSKAEIIDAIKKINYSSKKITEENIEKNFYTNLPFPDILVRTGGQKRLSNFMLWQLSYSEIFFLDKLWPDFSKKDLKIIINKFKKIRRNFGSI